MDEATCYFCSDIIEDGDEVQTIQYVDREIYICRECAMSWATFY